MSAEDLTQKEFDYVVCGGGTAGLVVAARLTEDPHVTVAVIEAGGNGLDNFTIDAPNLSTKLYGQAQYDWDYKTVPQKETVWRVHGWPRGKILGGSSAINFNMFSMASRQDLANWVELGNDGWSFDDMKYYYRKSETYHPTSSTFAEKLSDRYLDASIRGSSGPIQVCFPGNDATWIQGVWPATILNAGYEPPKDPRNGSAIGGFNQPTTVDPKHNRRSYAARDYYEPSSCRPNLSLLTRALVSRIELKKTRGLAKATGVQFIANGVKYTVKAKKEVIVCGGSVNSPQILELSGIGSAAVLQKAGVNVIVESPGVGENLVDHTATVLSLRVKDEYPTAEALERSPELMHQATEAYIQHKTGPFMSPPTTTAFASLEKIQPNFPIAKQHIQALLEEYATNHPDADLAGRNMLLARQLLDPKEAVCQIVTLQTGGDVTKVHTPSKVFPSDEPGMWIVIAACSTRSLSRGYVHITSSNPAAHPTIDPAYLQHPLDLDMMARATLHCLTLTEVEPLKSVFRRDDHGNLIGAASGGKLPKTLDEAKGYVSRNTATQYHPVGTCAMLPKEKGGVVNSELRVYGTSNVRVIDASIFPTHVQGNIVSLVYALAEKGADIVKKAGKMER